MFNIIFKPVLTHFRRMNVNQYLILAEPFSGWNQLQRQRLYLHEREVANYVLEFIGLEKDNLTV